MKPSQIDFKTAFFMFSFAGMPCCFEISYFFTAQLSLCFMSFFIP